LVGPKPMASNIDDVVDTPEDAIVTISRLHSAVPSQVRPVPPVATLSVLAVSSIVLLNEAIRVLPDRLEPPGPGVLDADVPGPARACRDLLPHVIIVDGINPGRARSSASGLHGVRARPRAAKKTAVLGLPPGVDDDCLTLADNVEVPPPHRRLDGFADGRHVLETMI